MPGLFAIIANASVSPFAATVVPARAVTASSWPVLALTVLSFLWPPRDRTGTQFRSVPLSPATDRPSTSGEPGPASTSNPATAAQVRRVGVRQARAISDYESVRQGSQLVTQNALNAGCCSGAVRSPGSAADLFQEHLCNGVVGVAPACE